MIRFLAVCLAVIAILNIASAQGDKRIALVIGNKNYRYGGELTYPIIDAETMNEVLEELNFEVIYLVDGTKTQMTTSYLQFIREVDNANISLIYYSGHGMQIDGVNRLIPVDANITDKFSARGFTININDWVGQLEANEENVNIIILDACRNNPFKAFTKSVEKGLKPMLARGTIISFATRADDVAQDNGLFAKTLAIEMRKDQRIIDVFLNTRNTIQTQTNQQQSPMEWTQLNRAVNLVADGNDSDLAAVEIPNKSSYSKRSPITKPNHFIDARDNNVYKIVKIGNQTWMAENLKAIKYNDGNAIPLLTDKTGWSELRTPAYCWYNNDEAANKNTYGALYNWYAVNTDKLCPTGWHVPTDDEWDTLVYYLGGLQSGGKFKETGTEHWNSPNTGATNESGFTALPGGYRDISGFFSWLGNYGFWWSAAEYSSIDAWGRTLFYGNDGVDSYSTSKEDCFSVRCVRD